jgi:hypothetical protein
MPLAAGSAKQVDAAPTRKVIAGGVAGAIAVIAVFALNTYVLPADKPLTADIAVAVTTVLSFLISYLVPPAASDQVTAV